MLALNAPDIAATIFSKITAANVFVADISIACRSEKRSTPNSNVLIELGYARIHRHGSVVNQRCEQSGDQ
jgi:hypothetical protein